MTFVKEFLNKFPLLSLNTKWCLRRNDMKSGIQPQQINKNTQEISLQRNESWFEPNLVIETHLERILFLIFIRSTLLLFLKLSERLLDTNLISVCMVSNITLQKKEMTLALYTLSLIV